MLSIHKKDNQLIFAGKAPSELDNIAGGTPCYVYDRMQIKTNIIALKKVLPKKIKLHYAIKANPKQFCIDAEVFAETFSMMNE